MSGLFVRLGNWLTHMRKKRVQPENLLLLLPSCLQNSDCDRKIVEDAHNCKHCGKCKIKDLVELADRYGIRIAAVTGGRLAIQHVKAEDVHAVVAVACGLELKQGMLKSFPKAVLGVVNLRPHGPCVDTDVEVEQVETAVRWFLGLDDTKPACPEQSRGVEPAHTHGAK